MTKQELIFYRERTLKRLVELVNKQAIGNASSMTAWMTKKLIEDNRVMAEMLANTEASVEAVQLVN
jgi:hypothetical protein